MGSTATLLAYLALVSCQALPVEGPLSGQITDAEIENNTADFIIIDASKVLETKHSHNPISSLRSRFGRGTPTAYDLIGAGDRLNVSVWESDPNGLFSKSGNDLTGGSGHGQVLGIEVESSGYIRFPYVGRVRAAGRRPSSLSVRLAKSLASRTSNPQVHVERVGSHSKLITVGGVVSKPGTITIGAGKSSLLDVIAAAGGATKPHHQCKVIVSRGTRVSTMYLDRLIASPSENIFVSPNDIVSLEHAPKHFLAFGAAEMKGRIAFPSSQISLLDAVAVARGLKDKQADPEGIFLFRRETARTVISLGYGNSISGRTSRRIPIIYKVNLRDPNHYFFAEKMSLKNNDILYIANAKGVQVEKFLTIIGRGVGLSNAIPQ